MSRDSHHTDETPIEGVLRSLPAEDPPADLERRIVNALAQEEAKRPTTGKSGNLWVPRLLAAAAVTILIASTQMPRLLSGASGGAREEIAVAQGYEPATPEGPVSFDRQRPSEAPMVAPRLPEPPTAEPAEPQGEPVAATEEAAEPAVSAHSYKAQDSATMQELDRATADQAAEAPSAGLSAAITDEARPENEIIAPMAGAAPGPSAPPAEDAEWFDAPAGRSEVPMAAPQATRAAPPFDGHAKMPPAASGAGDRIRTTAPPASRNTPTPGYGLPDDFDAPETPWRDDSGDRQLVTTSRMEVEVRDVEEAFDRTTKVLERAHAVFVSQDLEILERGRATAHISARVPLDQVDGVIAQIRLLGKVVRLSSDSVDRSRDYYGRGGEIREGGQTEDELVAEYEAEQDAGRKQELYRQIQALREHVQGRKTQLEDLSEKTHSVLLEVTLTGRQGPVEFLAWALPDVGQAMLWVLGTAVFWGPLAIAAWIGWRRVRSTQ